MPTLMPPVSAKALRFWSWYCHRSPIEGFQIEDPVVGEGELAEGGPDEDEHETSNTTRSPIAEKRRQILTPLSTGASQLRSIPGNGTGASGRGRMTQRGAGYALTPGAGAQRL